MYKTGVPFCAENDELFSLFEQTLNEEGREMKKKGWFKVEMSPEAIETFGRWLSRVVLRLERKLKIIEGLPKAHFELERVIIKAESVLEELLNKFGSQLAPESFRQRYKLVARRLTTVLNISTNFLYEEVAVKI